MAEDPLPPALVLTAGLGNRLAPLTHVRAKPAVPVVGVPIILRVLRDKPLKIKQLLSQRRGVVPRNHGWYKPILN